MARFLRRGFYSDELLIERIRRLIQKIQDWSETSKGTEVISFSRDDARFLEAALSEALDAPVLRRQLEAIQRRVRGAHRIVRNEAGPGRFKKAARHMGWLIKGPGGRRRKYPRREVAWAYHELTHGQGQVQIANEYVDFADEESLRVVDHCPLEPWEAIKVLVEHFRFRSAAACLKYLQRIRSDRKRLVKQRASQARRLPALRNLPYAAENPDES